MVVKELETGYVILGWNQHFYGYSLFICKQHVVELFDLDVDFRIKYLLEMTKVAEAVKNAFGAEKKTMNVSVMVMFICIGTSSREKPVIYWNMAITVKVLYGGCPRK